VQLDTQELASKYVRPEQYTQLPLPGAYKLLGHEATHFMLTSSCKGYEPPHPAPQLPVVGGDKYNGVWQAVQMVGEPVQFKHELVSQSAHDKFPSG